MLKRMDAARARQLIADAATSPLTDPFVEYPGWYLQRWHFLPEGYLSRRSAAGYDHLIRNVYSAFQERRITRAVLSLMRASAPREVLELGCGPGHLLRAVSQARIAQRVTGMDLSPFMLERAQQHNRAGVELVHSSGLDLPWERPQFDAVVASHYFGHLPEAARPTALAEAVRVLTPGGLLYVVDHAWHPPVSPATLTAHPEQRRVFGAIRLSVFERAPSPLHPPLQPATIYRERERSLA